MVAPLVLVVMVTAVEVMKVPAAGLNAGVAHWMVIGTGSHGTVGIAGLIGDGLQCVLALMFTGLL